MEAFELSKLINSINSILLQDVSTVKTISSTEMWLLGKCRDRSLRMIYTYTHINMNVADKGYQSLKLSVLDTI